MTLIGYGFWRWEAACSTRQALRCDGADLPPS
jgi:hypothetical protein